MHVWGDNWPYWDELYEAQTEIHQFVRRWSGCYLCTKEKWGSVRYETMLYPGWKIQCRLKGALRRLEYRWIQGNWLTRLWLRWAFFLTKRKVLSILKSKPYLAQELLNDLVTDDRFRFPAYWAVLCGWRSNIYGNLYDEEKDESTEE